MNNVLLDSANQQIAQQRWRGLRVLAVDGSTGRLPDFLAIEEYFGKPSGSGVPLARFSRLFDVLNDQILHADMVPYFYFVIFPTPAGGKQPRRPVFVGVVHE